MYRSFLAGSATLALTATSALADERANVLSTYADIALAGYSDSLMTALALQDAVTALVATPSVETLDAARTAWIAARVPYQQTEVFRFGNPIGRLGGQGERLAARRRVNGLRRRVLWRADG